MDLGQGQDTPGVDPEVKAFIHSLVSALGGSSAGDDGRYVLGDDALAVLKDIKRWLRLYDDKLNRLDVARLLSDANLVKGDLLEILASWPEDAPEGSFRSKVSLLCVDLLTQLTWPIHQDEQTATIDRYFHLPSLQKAQAGYKSAVLNHPDGQMLRTIIRVCLPAMAQAREERSPYDDNIIKVVLFFMRNIARITQPSGLVVDEVESGVDRSTTVDEFHYQDVFNLILAICSNMNEAFDTHDVEILDIVFHMVKGVDVESLFMEKQEIMSANTRELKDLMGREKGMLATYARHAPSRHNRFGTMMWIKRDGSKHSTLFGQKGAANEQLSMAEMDAIKKWRKPRRPVKKDDADQTATKFDTGVHLTSKARRHLRAFVEQFLDSSFNPLFLAVRRAIEREVPRVMDAHRLQYLYLISWFLRAECARRRKADPAQQQTPTTSEVESFALVATVLNQETFVLLNRYMEEALDKKRWQDLNAGMKCFTQILLTVQEMLESPLDEDQEIAENILNRIFYEQTTHDRIVALLRSYINQGFGFLDACTELAHVFLRLLERYSKQNVDMQVRSRRRARRKKRVAQPSNDASGEADDRELEADDVAAAQKTSSERKFDFNRFAARFISQASVDTFVAFLRYYQDLTPAQLKRAHRFFYRISFKMELTVYLFRMDIITLLNRLIRGPEGLNIANPTYKEWEELVRQIFRRLVKRMQERPALAVELLFSKIPSTMYYLEHGYEREIVKKAPRPVAELEMKAGLEKDDQIGVAVSVLINQGKSDSLAWLKSVILDAANERTEWQEANIAMRSIEHTSQSDSPTEEAAPEEASSAPSEPADEQPKAPSILVKAGSEERRDSLHKDKHLRLLLSVLGFERVTFDPEATETTWIIPSLLTAAELSRLHELINKFEFSPPTYDDDKAPEDFVRRKTAQRATHALLNRDDEDDEDGAGDSDDSLLERMAGEFVPSSRNKSNRTNGPRRQRRATDELLDDRGLEERRQARKQLEADRLRKIKSDLLVRESDDDTDEERDREFFSREAKMRAEVEKKILEAERRAREDGGVKDNRKKAGHGGKRKAAAENDEEDDSSSEVGSVDELAAQPAAKRRRSTKARPVLSDDESVSDIEAPISRDVTPAPRPGTAGDTARHDDIASSSDGDDTSAETDTETPPSSQRPSSGPSSQSLVGKPKSSHGENDDAEMEGGIGTDSDKENRAGAAPTTKRTAMPRRNVRAGFIIDSDSDD